MLEALASEALLAAFVCSFQPWPLSKTHTYTHTLSPLPKISLARYTFAFRSTSTPCLFVVASSPNPPSPTPPIANGELAFFRSFTFVLVNPPHHLHHHHHSAPTTSLYLLVCGPSLICSTARNDPSKNSPQGLLLGKGGLSLLIKNQ